MNVTVSKLLAGAIVSMTLVFAAPAMAERDRHHYNGGGYHQSQHHDGGYRRHQGGHYSGGYRGHRGGHHRVDHYYHRPARHYGGHHHGGDAIAVVGGALLVGGILHHLAH